MHEKRLSRRDMLATGLAGAMFASGAAASAAPATTAGRAAETAYSTEVLVVGGGPAGMAAASMAARLGCKVLLVERYGRMGGMAVQGMVGPLMGSVKSPFVDEVLQRIGGRSFDSERLDLPYASIVRESGPSCCCTVGPQKPAWRITE